MENEKRCEIAMDCCQQKWSERKKEMGERKSGKVLLAQDKRTERTKLNANTSKLRIRVHQHSLEHSHTHTLTHVLVRSEINTHKDVGRAKTE